MAFLPDTNLWISLLKNPGGKLDAMVQSQPAPDILLCAPKPILEADVGRRVEIRAERAGRQGRVRVRRFTVMVGLELPDASRP